MAGVSLSTLVELVDRSLVQFSPDGRYGLHPLLQQHTEEKLIPIVQKTWKKMTDAGHEAALKLDYAPEDLALIQTALQDS